MTESNTFVDHERRARYVMHMRKLLFNCVNRVGDVVSLNSTLTLEDYVHDLREVATLARQVGNVATDFANEAVIELSTIRRKYNRERAPYGSKKNSSKDSRNDDNDASSSEEHHDTSAELSDRSLLDQGNSTARHSSFLCKDEARDEAEDGNGQGSDE